MPASAAAQKRACGSGSTGRIAHASAGSEATAARIDGRWIAKGLVPARIV